MDNECANSELCGSAKGIYRPVDVLINQVSLDNCMMKNAGIVFCLTVVFLAGNLAFGLDLAEIDRVRDKGVLSGGDFEVIDSFVNEAINALIDAEDYSSVSSIRAAIIERARSNRESAQTQYREQFFSSINDALSNALDQVVSDNERIEFLRKANLLILIEEISDARLASLALKGFDSDNPVVRYWAVRAVSSSDMIQQLNQTRHVQTAREVTQRMSEIVDESADEVVELIANYAAGIDVPQGSELLADLVDTRLERYENWQVERPLVDSAILKLLNDQINTDSEQGQASAERFCQLFSYIMQAFIEGQDYYSQRQLRELASALVEIERSVVGRRTSLEQSVIRRAIENEDFQALREEHDRLLGDGDEAGTLQQALQFSYSGPNPRSPRSLPDRPGS